MVNHSNSFMLKLLSICIVILIFSGYGYTQVVEVGAIGLTVSDMEQGLEFYQKVLGFKEVSDTEVYGSEYEHLQGVFGLRMRIVRLRLGEEFIELTEYLTPQGRPIPVDSRSNDHWFQHIAIVVSDMDSAYAHLRKFNVKHASTAPQTIPVWNKEAAGIRAFYFRDPDLHYLEIIYFPPGKSNPKWQDSEEKLFLGIDHTAIVVSNTENSLKFYRDLLGLRIAGQSENYGTEQEHLNNVFGARLLITGLKADKGPGIEFLEYLSPGDGKFAPADIRANDIFHWQTNLIVNSDDNFENKIIRADINLVSPGFESVDREMIGFKKGLLIRDPDRHAMRLIIR